MYRHTSHIYIYIYTPWSRTNEVNNHWAAATVMYAGPIGNGTPWHFREDTTTLCQQMSAIATSPLVLTPFCPRPRYVYIYTYVYLYIYIYVYIYAYIYIYM